MNFEQYRDAFIARAGVETDAMRRFREGDAECARWWRQAQAFEAHLREALAVPVPDGDALIAGVMDRVRREAAADAAPAAASGGRAVVRRRRWRLPAALAAGVILAVTVGALWRTQQFAALEQLAVAHVDHHRSALRAAGPVPLASLRQAFAGFGRTPQSVPAGLSFVSVCPLGAERTVHLVLRNDAGDAVTGYFLRRAPRRAPADFVAGDMAGRYQPLAGGGALLLVANDAAEFDRAARAIENALLPAGGQTAAAR